MVGRGPSHRGSRGGDPEATLRSRGPDLEEVLSLALPLATGSETRKLEALSGRLRRRRLRVLVAGEAKRGKSTLVNALLARPLLPTGVTPLTAVATTVTATAADQPEHAVVALLTGESRSVALDSLATVVTEPGNPGNAAGIDTVTVYVRSPLLERHAVDLVDTPGTGSVYAHNTNDARRAITSLDAAVLVLSVDPPISDAERELLGEIERLSLRTFVLLNKSDRLSLEEVDEAVAFTRDVCSAAAGRPVAVRACSARAGAADPGFAAFTAELDAYLDQCGERDIDSAADGHLARALSAMVDSRRIRVRALELTAAGKQHRVEELRVRLAAIAERRRDIADRCAGSLSRLRGDLDRSAADAVAPISRACRRSLDERWATDLNGLEPAAAEDQARDAVTSFIAGAVDRWRTDQTTTLEAGLAAVIDQAEQDVAIQAQLAREAIEDLLDLTLERRPQLPRLEVDAAFRYDFARPEGWAPPLRGLASRVGTASQRRQRARRRVADEVASLTDRQLGRARSDLQRRLGQAGRPIRRTLEDHLAEAIDVFADLLAVVSADRVPDADRSPAEGVVLREQAARLQLLLAGLGELRPG